MYNIFGQELSGGPIEYNLHPRESRIPYNRRNVTVSHVEYDM